MQTSPDSWMLLHFHAMSLGKHCQLTSSRISGHRRAFVDWAGPSVPAVRPAGPARTEACKRFIRTLEAGLGWAGNAGLRRLTDWPARCPGRPQEHLQVSRVQGPCPSPARRQEPFPRHPTAPTPTIYDTEQPEGAGRPPVTLNWVNRPARVPTPSSRRWRRNHNRVAERDERVFSHARRVKHGGAVAAEESRLY